MTQESTDSPRILTVDDDKGTRDIVTAGLTRAGYQCLGANGADEAAFTLKKDGFDLVLLDIMMPVKNGIEYLPELISEHPDIAVLMLTGEADVTLAVRAMRERAYDYLVKPVGLAELIIRVEHALSKRALLVENRGYQQRQEEVIDELNALLAQRQRELQALNKLFQSQMGQSEVAQRAYSQLKESLAEFTSQLEGLVTVVGMSSRDPDDSNTDYQLKRVKID